MCKLVATACPSLESVASSISEDASNLMLSACVTGVYPEVSGQIEGLSKQLNDAGSEGIL